MESSSGHDNNQIWWMVFGNPKNVPNFIEEWAEKYKNRHGFMPNRCYINPIYGKIDLKTSQISIVLDKYVPVFNFWFTISAESNANG